MKEPEAKVLKTHCENRDCCLLCDECTELLENNCPAKQEVVDIKDAVAFAEARVKEAVDKRKQEFKEWWSKRPQTLWSLEDPQYLDGWMKSVPKAFLEEAKQP